MWWLLYVGSIKFSKILVSSSFNFFLLFASRPCSLSIKLKRSSIHKSNVSANLYLISSSSSKIKKIEELNIESKIIIMRVEFSESETAVVFFAVDAGRGRCDILGKLTLISKTNAKHRHLLAFLHH